MYLSFVSPLMWEDAGSWVWFPRLGNRESFDIGAYFERERRLGWERRMLDLCGIALLGSVVSRE